MLSSSALLLALLAAEQASGAPGPPAAAPAAASEAPPSSAATLEEKLDALQARVDAQSIELESLRLEQAPVESGGDDGASAERQVIRLYGFADAGLQRLMPRENSALNGITPSREATFVLGNVNFYLDAQPSERWSALIEVRLTNYPHGMPRVCNSGEICPGQTTEGYDLTSGSGGWSKLRWGSIVLERAYLQYRHSDAFTVRVGTFLTPFGIWNIDHGTPTLISLMLPQFEVNELFPTRQTGVELLGNTHRGEWEVGYFGYVSNGRTSGLVDFTDDKMLGGRLYARRTLPPRLTLGLSGLAGRFSEEVRTVESFLPYRISRREAVAFWEKAGGADLALDLGPLRIRWELSVRRVDYEPGKREIHYGQAGLFNADRLEWDTYLLAAYRLPVLNLEPFAYFEVYRVPTFVSEGVVSPSVGVNVHFAPWAQLKTQYMYGHVTDLPDVFSGSSQHDFHMVGTRLVLAF